MLYLFKLKSVGKALISDMRGNLVTLIRTGSGSKDEWRNSVEGELYRFNDKIYKAFKEQYVRYADVRVTQTYPWSVKKEDGDRPKRHRNTKLRGEKSEKMWTASSALFFAATTMATIGYGNIVPATSSGRIACVVFALFGAPLAIITIGDLGKFLSECTIWLYKEMKKGKTLLRARWRRFRGLSKEHQDAESQSSSSRSLEWEDLVMDKTEVPVFMVFTILLLYIAFGGILFSFLEGWTYMDAFYYSFISLTTIGFGDIVPENHDYIVLMLAYLGIGLAVTTMCIDLVGIQYIQKIHYFGRKFRGTDLLHLLKRKRMIERRLAMGQGEEILQMYIQQMQSQLPDPVVVDQQWEEDKTSSHLEWQIDDALVSSHYSYDFPLAIHVPSPNVLSIRSMLKRWRSRGESWDESGPSISEHCSLSTEPSVHIRQAYWDNYQSPNASLSSFEYEVPLPSPDYQGIALSARRSRRLRSCPSGITVPASQSVRNRSLPESARRQPCFCTQHDPLLFSPPLSFRISKPFMLSKLAVQCDSPPPDVPVGFESPPVPRLSPMENVQQSELCYPRCFTPSVVNETIGIPRLELSDSPPPSSRRSHRFRSTLFSIPEWRQSSVVGDQEGDPAPLMKRKKRERLARLNDPLHNVDWLNVSPRVMQLVKDDLPKLFEHVRDGASSSSSIVLVSPRTPIGMACMEDWDSYIRMLEEYNKPYERNESAQRSVSIPLAPKPKMAPTPSSVQKLPPTNSAAPPCVHAAAAASSASTPRSSVSGASARSHNRDNKVPLAHVYKVIRFYSFWKTCTSFHRIVTMIDRVTDDRHVNPDFKKRLFVQYLWRNAKAVEKARVQKEFDPRRQRLLRFVTDPSARKRFQKM
ncbi:Ion channel [Necator americanus]|uniref:Ion channel n=1 Tax=Necator americanus TaxID=51031 RepID=W2SQ77_NECAM|nr:Ion channel [Necator americanus]ETN71869.1 Ion channel [Necator americanus]